MKGTMMKEKLADKVDINNLYFEKSTRVREEKAVVTYAKSTKTLYFNPKMTALLNIAGWKAALVGLDKATGIVVLKESELDVYGCVPMRFPATGKNDKQKAKDRASVSRMVYIGHLLNTQTITASKAYRAERDGMMVFLKAVD